MPHRANFAVTLPSLTSRLYMKSVHLIIIIIRRGEGFEFCIHVSLLFCNITTTLCGLGLAFSPSACGVLTLSAEGDCWQFSLFYSRFKLTHTGECLFPHSNHHHNFAAVPGPRVGTGSTVSSFGTPRYTATTTTRPLRDLRRIDERSSPRQGTVQSRVVLYHRFVWWSLQKPRQRITALRRRSIAGLRTYWTFRGHTHSSGALKLAMWRWNRGGCLGVSWWPYVLHEEYFIWRLLELECLVLQYRTAAKALLLAHETRQGDDKLTIAHFEIMNNFRVPRDSSLFFRPRWLWCSKRFTFRAKTTKNPDDGRQQSVLGVS